ncbi:MAG TPA: DEAD/DEAH box helicase [Dermatophilaceae bacterium]|nr:DEAD/DEAH box helicase [Dermatophilaceae bacterium]
MAAAALLEQFAQGLGFPLDDFQRRACRALADGRGVLVAAPTGAGKTVVGEFAVHLGLATGRKAFYTTPIKALSNQKYADLVRRYGPERVGLLTGDSTVNGEAPIVVMTTEVLRNMMYAGSPTVSGLGFVVMDEVHYLADRFRGAVWEEVIIHLPAAVQVASLSATVSNAEEFGAWLKAVRGDTEVIVEEHRPVPLWQHMMVGQELVDLFVDEFSAGRPGARVNPQLLERIKAFERPARYEHDARYRRGRSRAVGLARGGRPGGGATRAETVQRLDRSGLLPAITFIFSRAGCDAAVGQLLRAGTRLVTHDDGMAIRRTVQERVAGIAGEDLAVLGYADFLEGLSRGFAAHHAGMLPTFREVVEELFTAGRIQVVFATETLALGINMPARTVVIERLVKFNGEAHADITPAEYTQLTGRAGRRGIDVEGHAVVLYARGLDPIAVGGLASTRTYPLRSSFQPTSNMAVNLVGKVGRDTAREVLETSFAQFQADRAVVGLVQSVRRNEEALTAYAEAMACDLGDFAEYAAIRNQIRELEREEARARSAARRAEAALSLERLKPGDVIKIPAGRRSGYAVVLHGTRTGKGGRDADSAPTVLTADGQVRRITLVDVPGPVEPATRVAIPKSFNARSPRARRDLAATLRVKVPHEPPRRRAPREAGSGAVEQLRAELRQHPCHGCPDREEHARWAERWWRLRRETDGLAQRVEGRANTVARAFDRICDVLDELGYLADGGTRVTPAGRTLARLYTERDLLAAQCLRHGVWRDLGPADLAAAVSTLVHEPRGEDLRVAARLPTAAVERAYDAMVRLAHELAARAAAHGLAAPGDPDPGLAEVMHRWASGGRLDAVLRDADLAPGDFVRRCKQVADLLGQIADAAVNGHVGHVGHVGATARLAMDAVVRGVVAADRID